MNISSSVAVPVPVNIKRLPWMRQIYLHSPKAGRFLSLFSYPTVRLWALLESRPSIVRFCEYPGYVTVNGEPVIADFWVDGEGRQQFMVLEDSQPLQPEHPKKVPVFRDVAIDLIKRERLESDRVWIDNWFQINPYIVSNARFLSPPLLDRVLAVVDGPRALFDIEHALRPFDPQLVRTGLFMLLHQGKITSDDLSKHALDGATRFCSNSKPSVRGLRHEKPRSA